MRECVSGSSVSRTHSNMTGYLAQMNLDNHYRTLVFWKRKILVWLCYLSKNFKNKYPACLEDILRVHLIRVKQNPLMKILKFIDQNLHLKVQADTIEQYVKFKSMLAGFIGRVVYKRLCR